MACSFVQGDMYKDPSGYLKSVPTCGIINLALHTLYGPSPHQQFAKLEALNKPSLHLNFD